MFSSIVAAACVLAFASQTAIAQFVPTPTNFTHKTGYAGVPVRYKQVPAGICELDPKVKSFTGYADVSANEHIFFWFFEARNQDPTTAPLTVWINGGPGSSSMIGLWQENGPCGVDSNGNVYNNPHSWSNASNMIFIDQPAQVGFSYSQAVPAYTDPSSAQIVQLPSDNCPGYAADWGCATYSYPNYTDTASSTDGAAPNFWKTLQGFMGAFPQYSREEFLFTTESYGGHYGPIFNEYFETQNAKNISGAKSIKLGAVLIGNGWYDPIIQYQAYYNYTVSPGNTYDYSPFNKSVQQEMYNNLYGKGNCIDGLNYCAESGINEICSYYDNFCYLEVENIYDIVLNRDEYDMRELMPDPFPYEFYTDYLNTPHVQEAIGAFVNFSESSNAVSNAFGTTGDDGRRLQTVADMLKLIEANLTVIMYTGDADYNCNWLGGEVVSNEIGAPGFKNAGYTNITTSDGIVHGQVKQAGKFAFLRIYESGHEVPFYQPVVALEMFERAVKGLDIATGKEVVKKGYLTKGTLKSTYREGNSTIQFKNVGTDRTYNTTTNRPNPPKRARRSMPYASLGKGMV
jgi:carboxypeptidase C (cathepsin A)